MVVLVVVGDIGNDDDDDDDDDDDLWHISCFLVNIIKSELHGEILFHQ